MLTIAHSIKGSGAWGRDAGGGGEASRVNTLHVACTHDAIIIKKELKRPWNPVRECGFIGGTR